MRATNESCPISTPTLKDSRAIGQFGFGQSCAGESAGETESVQKAEGERHDPWMPYGEAGFASPRTYDFRAEEEDAESDGRIQREHGRFGIAEGSDRQRDAMGDGEGCDGLQQHPAVFDDQKQAEHKEHVVSAKENVPDALHDKAAHHLQTGLGGCDLDPGLRGVNDGGPAATVQHLDANQHVGDRALKAGELDALTRKAVGAGFNPIADE